MGEVERIARDLCAANDEDPCDEHMREARRYVGGRRLTHMRALARRAPGADQTGGA